MDKRVLLIGIIAIVAILFVITSFHTTTLEIVDGEEVHYDTEEETVKWWPPNSVDPQYTFGWGVPHTTNPNGEIEKRDSIVTSWDSNQNSQYIIINRQGVLPLAAHQVCPRLTKYWYNIVYYSPSGAKEVVADRDGLTSEWTNKITGITHNTFGSHRWSTGGYPGYSGQTFILGVDFWENSPPVSFPRRDEGDTCAIDSPYYWYDFSEDTWWSSTPPDPTEHPVIFTEPISFQIEGPHEGLLRISICSDMWWYDTPGTTTNRHHCKAPVYWTDDWVQLVRGECAITHSPSPYPETPNIFEEGDTLEVKIQTDYTGYNEDGFPGSWRVTFYDPYDVPIEDGITLVHPDGSTTGGTFTVEDLCNNGQGVGSLDWYTVLFNIPSGFTNQWDEYDWTVKIENSLYALKSDDFHIVIQGGHDDGPKNPYIEILDKNNPSSTNRQIYVSANGNPEGTNEVTEFNVRLYRNGLKYYEQDWPAVKEYGSNKYSAQYNVDTQVGIFRAYVVAYDSLNRPSAEASDSESIDEEGEPDRYLLYVTVKNNDLSVSGAIVIAGGSTKVTDTNGECSFLLSKDSRYTVSVEYRGEIKEVSVLMDKDGKELIINLGISTDMTISLAIIAIIIIVCSIVALILPVHIAYRIMIIVIGIVISIFVYLIMNGYLIP